MVNDPKVKIVGCIGPVGKEGADISPELPATGSPGVAMASLDWIPTPAPSTPTKETAMSRSESTGSIAWADLTVGDAEAVMRFYSRVAGWEAEEVSMGEYADFSMRPSGSDTPVAGICHARGLNASLPPVWMVYILVEDLDASLAFCREEGGEVLAGPTNMGPASAYAVIRDPAGAVCALYQSGS